MTKPYNWEEIESFLKKELDKSKYIMTFGTIGSLNIEHDIDVIITKKPSSKSSDFYEEVHNLFSLLNKYLLNKYNAKVIRHYSPSLEFLKLSNYSKQDLIIHSMVYTSYSQIEGDWNWALFPQEKLKQILSNSYNLIKGDLIDLFSKEFSKKKFYDSMFIYLSMYDKINSNYKDKILVKIMSEHYDYLFRKRLKIRTPDTKSVEDVKKNFYLLCDKLDKLELKK